MKGAGGSLLLFAVQVVGVTLVGVGWVTDSGAAILAGAVAGMGGYVLSLLGRHGLVRLLVWSERRRRTPAASSWWAS